MGEINPHKDIEEHDKPEQLEEIEEQTFLVKEEEMSPPQKDSEVVISDDEEYETEIVSTVCEKIHSPLSYISPVQVDFGGQPVHFMPKFRTFRKCELAAALKDVVSGTILLTTGLCCEMKDFQDQYQVDDETTVNMMIRKLQSDFNEKGFSQCAANAFRSPLHQLLTAVCVNEETELITSKLI